MLHIRKMEWKDHPRVIMVDQLAFSNHFRKTYGITRLSERIEEGIEAYLKRTGTEGLVAEYNGQIVGFIFLHQWGSLGWCGPFGIDPNYHRRGIGKRLLEEALQILDGRDVQEIGLETMVDTPSNVGFYMEMGFQPINLTLDLVRTVKPLKEAPPTPEIRPEVTFHHYIDFEESEFEELVTKAQQITSEVIPGLDYRSELELLLKFQFGRVILMEEQGEPCGIALLMTTDFRGQKGLSVSMRGVAIRPKTSELEYTRLSEILSQVYQVSRELGRSKVFLSVYSAYDVLTRYLLRTEKFTINFPYLRLVKRDPHFSISNAGIELSKWRG